MMTAPTPHIKAKPGDFGQTVLMPGDPLRSHYIAEHFLENPVLVNNVRGVQGYTGSYKGVRVSVMASGMGMPSIGIYSRELYEAYGVQNIMRIGSAGAIQPDINLKDIVMAMGASMDSNYQAQFHLMGQFAPICSFEMLHAAVQSAEELGAVYHVGNILSSDFFYDDDEGVPEALNPKKNWQKMGIMAIEMESAALYLNAARLKKNALCICTVSDQLVRHEYLSADERQTGFEQMMKVALETAVKLEK
ncbi:MAG: purine-nucleoside phosphorylase [Oscillospiraceae bacterium]|nr:purine-nucleoside phosphorylase [Oscillospiraceae bacterium]MBR7011020.1 purine-nucleoside phosphorylase [Oscillospiraceae bacterium]